MLGFRSTERFRYTETISREPGYASRITQIASASSAGEGARLRPRSRARRPAAASARSTSGSRSLMRTTRPRASGSSVDSSTASGITTVPSRDGIGSPCGSRDRVPELLVDRVEQPVAQRVLEHLGLVVHLVPAVAVLLHQPGLDEPVAAHHAQRLARARTSVSRTAPYGACSTCPAATSFFTISVTVLGASPSRAASCDGVIGSGCHSVWP